MNYRSNKKRKIIIIALLAVFLTATIGYAVLSTVLKNNITATILPVKWQVYMENPSIYEDTTSNTETNTVSLSNTADTCIEYDSSDSTLCIKSTALDANVKFNTLDEYVIVKFYTINAGDVPVIIAENGIQVEGLGEIINYSLKYTNSDTGRDVQPGDYFAPGASKPMYLKIKYSVSDSANLPTEETTYNITIKINYSKGSNDDAANDPGFDEPSKPAITDTTASTVISKSTIGSSNEITSYTTAMAENADSKLYLLESTADDENPIYFWRGTRANTNNNFIFAGKCWLGIRTTNTGGIKIIYNGDAVDGTCLATTGADTMISSGHYNDVTNTAEYYISDTQESNAKTTLDAWYETNLQSYADYLEDTVYCNDLGSFYSSRRTTAPSLTCEAAQSYTVSTEKGNGKLKYPIALISADEAMFSGATEANSAYHFLYNNQNYWTMTQGSASSNAYYVGSYGYLSNGGVDSNTFGFRPVVSLNAGVSIAGTGTINDPFVVSKK